jgi:hypothetical protein
MSKKVAVNTSRNQCLLIHERVRCVLCTTLFMWYPRISTQISALRRTEVSTLSKIPGFTRVSWQALSTPCCNTRTCKSLIGAEFPEVFRCARSQKCTGLRAVDCAGKLTGPPCPIHCSPKSLVQVLSDNAEKMRWCPIMHEPRVLSLMKTHMFLE